MNSLGDETLGEGQATVSVGEDLQGGGQDETRQRRGKA